MLAKILHILTLVSELMDSMDLSEGLQWACTNFSGASQESSPSLSAVSGTIQATVVLGSSVVTQVADRLLAECNGIL